MEPPPGAAGRGGRRRGRQGAPLKTSLFSPKILPLSPKRPPSSLRASPQLAERPEGAPHGLPQGRAQRGGPAGSPQAPLRLQAAGPALRRCPRACPAPWDPAVRRWRRPAEAGLRLSYPHLLLRSLKDAGQVLLEVAWPGSADPTSTALAWRSSSGGVRVI